MTIYNMKPAWVAVVDQTKEELGRELTGEEVMRIYNDTKKYSEMLGDMYSRYLGMADTDYQKQAFMRELMSSQLDF